MNSIPRLSKQPIKEKIGISASSKYNNLTPLMRGSLFQSQLNTWSTTLKLQQVKEWINVGSSYLEADHEINLPYHIALQSVVNYWKSQVQPEKEAPCQHPYPSQSYVQQHMDQPWMSLALHKGKWRKSLREWLIVVVERLETRQSRIKWIHNKAVHIIPRVPSGEATNPLNKQLPSSFLQAYPAIGVRQDPSKVSRKALSQATASLVSWWFSEAMYSACTNQPTNQPKKLQILRIKMSKKLKIQSTIFSLSWNISDAQYTPAPFFMCFG